MVEMIGGELDETLGTLSAWLSVDWILSLRQKRPNANFRTER